MKGDIISYAGCQLVLIQKHKEKNTYKQDFIKIDSSPLTTNPEITAMEMSSDKHILYIGTTEKNAQLIVWNISTRTQLYSMPFKNIVEISLVKVSETQSHAVLLALNQDAQRVMIFLNLPKKKVLACHTFRETAEIHGVQFLPLQEFKFLFCGSRMVGEVSYQANLLSFEHYGIESPKDCMDSAVKTQVLSMTVFYSLIFLQEGAITSGSDGYLYLWQDKKIVKKQNAHPKAAILSLFTSKNSKIFVSGAVDGKAIVWQVSSNSIFQKKN